MAEVKSDIEIARAANKKPILEVGAGLGIGPDVRLADPQVWHRS